MANTVTHAILCPRCTGRKQFVGISFSAKKCFEVDCHICNGVGAISRDRFTRYAEGQLFRNLRVAANVGMREFAERCGILPSDFSKMEQGDLPLVDSAWLKLGEARLEVAQKDAEAAKQAFPSDGHRTMNEELNIKGEVRWTTTKNR